MPKRIQRQRTRGWRMPEGAVPDLTTYSPTERIVWPASCATCGWHRNYTTSSSASRGRRRHRCGGVRRPRATKPQEVRYNDGLYGGRWVLHPVRRVLVWEQQW